MDELVFTRKQTPLGTEFHAEGGRVVVRKTSWAKPGFKNITSTGWVVEADGEQVGAAYPSAKNALARSNDPGTLERLRGVLAANDAEDDASEDDLKAELVKAALDWAADGAEVDLGALSRIEHAAGKLRAWQAKRP